MLANRRKARLLRSSLFGTFGVSVCGLWLWVICLGTKRPGAPKRGRMFVLPTRARNAAAVSRRRSQSCPTLTGHPPAPRASTAERSRGHTARPRPSPAPSVCTPRRRVFGPGPHSLQAVLNRPAARRCVHWHACRRPRPAQPLQISAPVLEDA